MKFLGQAKKFFRVLATEPEAKAQHFNVRCVSGHRVRGERTEGYQALRCPACGEGVFVLPRSPLPSPPAPERRAAPRSARADDRWVEEGPVELTDPARVSVDIGGDENVAADADIVWDDAPREPVPRVAKKRARAPGDSVDLGVAGPPDAAAKEGGQTTRPSPEPDRRARRDRKREPDERVSPEAPEPKGRRGRAHEDRHDPRPQAVRAAASRRASDNGELDVVHEIKPARPMRTLHRWLLVLVPLLVVGTVAWRVRQHVRNEYPLIVEQGRTEGIKALEEGNFDKAHQLLSDAKSAVNALGGAVEGADEIRQAADEAKIFVDLITEDLGDLLDKAGRADSPDSWNSKFDSVYKGRSIFIDSVITAVPDGTASSGFEMACVILPPGEASSLRNHGEPDRWGVIDFTGFKLFEQIPPEVGHRKIFGARLESFRFDKESGHWIIRLEPNSGVEITYKKALDAIGWQSDSTPVADEPKEDRP